MPVKRHDMGDRKAISRVLLAVAVVAVLITATAAAVEFAKLTTTPVGSATRTTSVPAFGSPTAVITASSSLSATKRTGYPFTIATVNTTVPGAYEDNYTYLMNQLTTFNQTLGPVPGQHNAPVYGADLVFADGNLGPGLFGSGTSEQVNLTLNMFQELGITGVTDTIVFPLLNPGFPNSSAYLAFFENLSRQVHARGMTLTIESAALLPNSGASFNWSTLPYGTFVSEDIQMNQLIINDVHPDVLEIMSAEPETEALATGYSQLNTQTGWTSFIQSMVAGLDKGSTKLSAGVDDWQSPQWLDPLASIQGLDYLSTHVYPLYGSWIQNLIQIGQIAQQNHKRIVIDEMWADKPVAPYSGNYVELAKNTYTQNVYSFWMPVDQEFLLVMAEYAEIYPVQYHSPFWPVYFSAYTNYTPTNAALSIDQLWRVEIYNTLLSLGANTITPVGFTYYELTHGALPLT